MELPFLHQAALLSMLRLLLSLLRIRNVIDVLGGMTQKVMGVMFDRLYTLRNQLLHGGATWNSNVNRSQISQGAEIMGQVVPIVIHLMMNDYQRVWGEACYPVVE